jgi:hypothetical protein
LNLEFFEKKGDYDFGFDLGEMLADAVAGAGGERQEGEGRKAEGGPTRGEELSRRMESFWVYAGKWGLEGRNMGKLWKWLN